MGGAFERITDYLPGVTAAADYSAKQFYTVYMSSDTAVTLCDATPALTPVGVLQNEPESGETAQVAYVPGDICKALCSVSTCTITRWNPLWIDSSARVIRQVTTGCPFFARSLVTTTASGVIPVMITGPIRLTTGSHNV